MIATILLVEDNPDDVLLLRRAFERVGIRHSVIHVENGELAVHHLGETGGAALTILVLLDIKMPKMDGFEVLKWIRSKPQFVDIPVLILTTSNMPGDMQRAEQLGASAFLTKPATFDQLVEMVREIEKKWFSKD